ncbi:MAG: trigger factor [Chloroflexota bacterium]|nr:trigger factor [Chloroflexota bacterium]
MKLSPQWTETQEAIFTIEAEPQELEQSMNVAYRDLSKRVKTPGFRKGKVPRDILERYVGREALMEEALKDLVPRLYNLAISKTNVEAIAEPHVELKNIDPVTFEARVPLRPEVELGDYINVRVPPEVPEFDPSRVEDTIERLREQHVEWESVDRFVEYGDLAIIDVDGGAEGEPPTRHTGYECLIDKESTSPLPGFCEHLVGMNKGDEREFDISYPEDYEDIQELAGQQFHFMVNLLEVKEKHLPDIDDEFARSIGQGLSTVEELRDRITKNLESMAEHEAKKRFEEKALGAVLEGATVSFPPVMLEWEIEEFLRGQAARTSGGRSGVDQYLESIGKSKEEVSDELRPLAAERVSRSLVLAKLAKEESIVVEPSEIDAEIEVILQGGQERNPELAKVLNSEAGRRQIRESILMSKTMQRLVEIASGLADESQGDSATQEEDDSAQETSD